MTQFIQDIFYEPLAPATAALASTTWSLFGLPLPSISIFRWKNGGITSTTETSLGIQEDCTKDGVTFFDTGSAVPPQLSEDSSVVAIPIDSHITETKLSFAPAVLPSTPPQHSHLRERYYEGYFQHEGSPTSSTPPLSPSSSRSTSSTSTSLSEPPTPTRNSNIDPYVFSTSPSSESSSIRTNSNDFGALLADKDSEWNDTNISSQQVPTPHNLEATRKPPSSSSSTTPSQTKKTKYTPKVYKGPKPILETGPFIFEGLHLVQYPKSDYIISPDILEAGHIIGYGSRPVQLTALQIARERRRVLRNKVRYYGVDEVHRKTVRCGGSVSGESESESSDEEGRGGGGRGGIGGKFTDAEIRGMNRRKES